MKNIFIILSLLLTHSHSSELSAMQSACENKVAVACHHIGILYDRGSGLKEDKVKAKEYYLKACDYGYDKACKRFEHIEEEN